MMLTSIRLKFGSTPDDAALEIDPGPITVFVGPHGAGKSLALAELTRSLCRGENDFAGPDWKFVADIEPGLPEPGERRERLLAAIRADLAPLRTVDAAQSAVLNTLVKILRDPDVEPETLEAAASWLAVTGKRGMVQTLIDHRKLYPPSSARPADHATLNLIHAVISHGDERLILDGFIDLRGYHRLYSEQCLQLAADTAPGALHERIAGDRRFIMIDGAGATLAPALAHQLGRELADLAMARDAFVFATTDSPEFLEGCVASGQRVDIIRLAQLDGHASAELLPRGELPTSTT